MLKENLHQPVCGRHIYPMPSTLFDEAWARVCELAADFKANEAHYLSLGYTEAQVRPDFIDKFFMALGWDVHHEHQKNPYEQEVSVEEPVHAAGQRRADYAFFLAPNFRDVRFFVEAKKPHGDIATTDNYFQTIRYAWNSETPLAVLTDFEQFQILDCRFKPDRDTALNRCIAKYHYSHYLKKEKFAEIYWLFSREAMTDGRLEKYAAGLPKPRGKAIQRGLFDGGWQSIDESFLQELDDDRSELAKAFKKYNPELDSEQLTEATQRALDRLVFIRFLEDKGIEAKRLVDKFGDKGTAWEDFIVASRRLDGIYNGIVFKDHPIIDKPGFQVDDDLFSGICEKLAHINSPYDFNAIPIHILGSIYERFLGKVIVSTDKRVRIEEKPEVRKAGGVYYTPEYIVRYIVENTVGKLIQGKTPNQIAEMRFADIACGSGSFLLGVYDLLLTYHGNWYNQNPGKAKKGDCITHDGRLYLSLGKKREILVNNIYGVDIDAQAVEVCQLSLYLKLLKEETPASARQCLLDFGQKALLPSLNKNIVCGNSLIGTDILDGQLFASEEERKINPMNFEDAFPDVFKGGGFDAIVGNPPYIRMEEFKPLKSYFKSKYAVHDERSDIYAYFIEREHQLLSAKGRFGMIVSNKFLRANYGAPLRNFLKEQTHIERIVDFAGLPVFKGATVRTIVLLTSQEGKSGQPIMYSPPLATEKFSQIEVGILKLSDAAKESEYPVAQSALEREVWSFPRKNVEHLLSKLTALSVPLHDYCKGAIGYGIKTGLEEAFVIDQETRNQILKANPEANEIIKPYLNGRDVRPFKIEFNKQYLIYTYHGVDIRRFPAIQEYLTPFKARLQLRATKQKWYELQQPQYNYSKYFDGQKIIVPDIATEPRFALDGTGYYGATTVFFIGKPDLYLLALLNSAVGHFYFAQTCAALEGKNESYLRFKTQYLQGFPVRVLNDNLPADKSMRAALEAKAKAITETNIEIARAKTEKDKTYYQNRCEALRRQINAIVCEIYELTPDEIALVEKSQEV